MKVTILSRNQNTSLVGESTALAESGYIKPRFTVLGKPGNVAELSIFAESLQDKGISEYEFDLSIDLCITG